MSQEIVPNIYFIITKQKKNGFLAASGVHTPTASIFVEHETEYISDEKLDISQSTQQKQWKCKQDKMLERHITFAY